MNQFIEWVDHMPPLARLLLLGLAIALPLLGISSIKPLLKAVSKLPGLAPNWLTLWRIPLVWGGFALYLKYDAYVGYCIIVFAFTLDRIDGKAAEVHGDDVAEFEDTFDELNHPGKTKMGEWLDAFIDKVTVVPLLLYFCIWGELSLPVVTFILLGEVAGTITRPPFRLLPLKMRQVSASWAGKMKFALLLTTLIVYMPVDQGWTKMDVIPNNFLEGAAAFMVLSFASKIEFRGWLTWINHLFDRLAFIDKAFKHN